MGDKMPRGVGIALIAVAAVVAGWIVSAIAAPPTASGAALTGR